MRNITTAMQSHLQQEVTSICTCVRIQPTESSHAPDQFMTEHDQPLIINGDTYTPKDGFKLSEIQMSTDFESDNTEITLGEKIFDDMEKYKNADVYIFLVNWKDLSMGEVPIFTGYITSMELNENHELKLTISGLGAKLAKRSLPRYSRTCRASLGDNQCGFPALPYGKVDVYETYPMTFYVGYTYLPLPSSLIQLTTQKDTDVPIGAASPTDLLLAVFDNEGSGAKLIQKDSSGNIIHIVKTSKSVRNLSTFVLPNTSTVRIETDTPTATVTVSYTGNNNINTTYNTLMRVFKDNVFEQFLLRNWDFVSDGYVAPTSNPGELTGWSFSGNQFSVIDGKYNAIGTTQLLQERLFPPLSCVMLSDGCYYLIIDTSVENVTGSAQMTLTIKDDKSVVLNTYNIDMTTVNTSRIKLIGEPYSLEVKLDIEDGTIDYVKTHLISSLTPQMSDDDSISLNSSADKGNAGDLWEVHTDQIAFTQNITAVTTDTRVFTIDNTTEDFSLGYVVFLDGPNAGVERKIRTSDNGSIEIYSPLPYTCDVGNKAIFSLGCDKTIQTCTLRFNNSLNFRGEPFMPTSGDI